MYSRPVLFRYKMYMWRKTCLCKKDFKCFLHPVHQQDNILCYCIKPQFFQKVLYLKNAYIPYFALPFSAKIDFQVRNVLECNKKAEAKSLRAFTSCSSLLTWKKRSHRNDASASRRYQQQNEGGYQNCTNQQVRKNTTENVFCHDYDTSLFFDYKIKIAHCFLKWNHYDRDLIIL